MKLSAPAILLSALAGGSVAAPTRTPSSQARQADSAASRALTGRQTHSDRMLIGQLLAAAPLRKRGTGKEAGASSDLAGGIGGGLGAGVGGVADPVIDIVEGLAAGPHGGEPNDSATAKATSSGVANDDDGVLSVNRSVGTPDGTSGAAGLDFGRLVNALGVDRNGNINVDSTTTPELKQLLDFVRSATSRDALGRLLRNLLLFANTGNGPAGGLNGALGRFAGNTDGLAGTLNALIGSLGGSNGTLGGLAGSLAGILDGLSGGLGDLLGGLTGGATGLANYVLNLLGLGGPGELGGFGGPRANLAGALGPLAGNPTDNTLGSLTSGLTASLGGLPGGNAGGSLSSALGSTPSSVGSATGQVSSVTALAPPQSTGSGSVSMGSSASASGSIRLRLGLSPPGLSTPSSTNSTILIFDPSGSDKDGSPRSNVRRSAAARFRHTIRLANAAAAA